VEAPPVVEPTPVTAILETVELPAAAGAGGGVTGGEWQELLDRLNGWLGDGRVSEIWQQSQRPLKALGAALALLLVLRLLGSVLGALDGVPMLPRLLQLVGLIWLGLYSSRHLVRSDSRQQLLARLDGLWASVVGRAD
jgi:CAAD domains of cyanobacterial aminoacyl-tRNA synthetase